MSKGNKLYLVEKRSEMIWSLHKQGYPLSDLAWVFGISKTLAFNLVKKCPEGWTSPWIKKYKINLSDKQITQKLMISTYQTWVGLKQRCDNQNLPQYKDYGGRGITYNPRWKKFENFLSDMGLKPSIDLSIDRINNDGNYTKTNCRWATRTEQALNKRNNKK